MASRRTEFVPPEAVADAARQGILLREEYGHGGTVAAVALARTLSRRLPLSITYVKRMVDYFDSNHENDHLREMTPVPTRSMISWLLWGGDAGERWARKVVDEHAAKVAAEKSKSTPGAPSRDDNPAGD